VEKRSESSESEDDPELVAPRPRKGVAGEAIVGSTVCQDVGVNGVSECGTSKMLLWWSSESMELPVSEKDDSRHMLRSCGV